MNVLKSPVARQMPLTAAREMAKKSMFNFPYTIGRCVPIIARYGMDANGGRAPPENELKI
jgi:hypothetical protein